jgi:acyl-CoA thioester hydrolase
VTSQLLDLDEKRFHFFQELHHADGWLSATGEGLGLHVDLAGPKVVPMPPETYDKIAAIYEDHRNLPRPARAGRSIGIKRK